MILQLWDFASEVQSPKNSSSYLNAFSKLVTMFNSDSVLNIQHPLSSSKKMCLCFDTVHIMKNIRNNFLNGKKFIFPEFIYNDGLHINVNCLAGYIRWKDLYDIYDLDKELEGHLRKAPKLLYQALHTANKKQFLWLY